MAKRTFFISFAGEDLQLQVASRLQNELKNLQYEVHLCDKSFASSGEKKLPDDEIRRSLEPRLQKSDCLIIVWSRSLADARWCRWELDYFRECHPGGPIAIFALDKTEIPDELSKVAIPFLDAKDLIASLDSPKCAELPAEESSLWPDGVLRLLFAPRCWARRLGHLPSNFSALDALTEPSEVRRRVMRLTLRTTLGAVIFTTAVHFLMYGLGTRCGAPEELSRQLLLSLMISQFGGLTLVIGHGVGAGAAALAISGAIGATATVVWVALGGHTGAPAGCTAAALVTSCATYRWHIHLKSRPLTGVASSFRPHWREVLWRALLGMAIGLGLLEAAFRSRSAFINVDAIWRKLLCDARESCRGLSWSDLPREPRLILGAAIGLSTGLGMALAFRQRLAFRARRSEARRRGWHAALAFLGILGIAGLATGFVEPIEQGSIPEGGVIGLLLAQLASFFLPRASSVRERTIQ